MTYPLINGSTINGSVSPVSPEPPAVYGFSTTQFGTPAGIQRWPALSMGNITLFGTPCSPIPQDAQAGGFSITRLGAPVAFGYKPPNDAATGQAFGFSETAFGAPNAAWVQSGNASGFASTQFGAGATRQQQGAIGFVGTQFGACHLLLAQPALGWSPTAFGQALGMMTLIATPIAPGTRFGTPGQVRSNSYSARGFCPTRLGQPLGYQRNNYHAGGWRSALMGAPGALHRHRIAAMPPATRFGTPLLSRSTQC